MAPMVTTGTEHRALVQNAAKSIFRSWFPKLTLRMSLRNHYWDEIEMDILDLIVSRDRAALDVGANAGRYTAALSRLASHVYAVEPNPRMARLLSVGLDQKRTTVLNCAASDSTGTATLSIPTDRWGNGGESLASIDSRCLGRTRSVSVRKMMLDELVAIDIGFMKLDIEGHELAALRGAENILEKWRPTILIECDEIGADTSAPSFDFLLSKSYEGHFVYSGMFLPLAELKPYMFDKSALSMAKARKLLLFTNNFLFFPQGALSGELLRQIETRLRKTSPK
jgi:FkbM family methyltransferase